MPVPTGGRMIQRTPNDPAWYRGGLYPRRHADQRAGALVHVVVRRVGRAEPRAVQPRAQDGAPEIADQQWAVIAPVLHCAFTRATENTVVGERSMGDARLDYNALTYGWFDHFLKGEENGLLDTLPKVRYFTMGSNRWQSSDTWPPAAPADDVLPLERRQARTRCTATAALVIEAAVEGCAGPFTYDPMNPVPSYGGNVCCTGNAVQGGAFDQRKMEEREDILVYTSEPFTDGLEVSGPIVPTLYVSSDARDTDFTVKLLDVYPDGRAYNLDETIQRMRYREGYDGPPGVDGEGAGVQGHPAAPEHEQLLRARPPASASRCRAATSRAFDRNLNTASLARR
jgi:uncharacterized protein